MHILTLGGNGFIGSHFVSQAVAAGHEVSVLSRRESPANKHTRPFRHLRGDLNELFEHPEWLRGVDAICHAAWSTVPKTAAADTLGDIQTNVVGLVKLLDMIERVSSIRQLLFLSSGGAVYGSVNSEKPIPESHILEPISAYGIGKLAAEKYCGLFSKANGLSTTIIRPSNPYGEGQLSLGLLGVVSTFVHHAKNDSAAHLYGDGTIVRDFLHVEDLAGLMLVALEKNIPGIYNCGHGKGFSLAQVIESVEKASGRRLKLVQHPARSFDPPKIVLDTTLAKGTFGWDAEIDFDTGIDRLYDSLKR